MKRLTYEHKGKHFCEYPTSGREIINHLAECEIMLDKIEAEILKWVEEGGNYSDAHMLFIKEIIDGNDTINTGSN